jgi:GxxExxY protein
MTQANISVLTIEQDELMNTIIGLAIEVHRHLGPGFLERIYEEALCYEFDSHCIHYRRQQSIIVPYKSIAIRGQRLDLIVEDKVITELKTVDSIIPIHESCLISYLKAMRIKAGLIINFKVRLLKHGIRRIVY